jgi:hypothetical protein
VTDKPEPKIRFNSYWVAIGQDEALNLVATLADHELITSDTKLLLLAIAKANNSGHANFAPGELQAMMATVDKQTGEIKPMTRGHIYKIKERLRKAGILVTSSGGTSCVWLSADLVQRNKLHGNWKCPVHNTYKRGYGDEKAEQTLAA